jgi:predicted ATPase
MVINNGEERYRIKILFETHSEAMINRLGYLIAKKKLNSDLINVVIFDKNIDSVNNGTKVCSTKFSDEGELTNWPIGFFSPERLKDDNTTR